MKKQEFKYRRIAIIVLWVIPLLPITWIIPNVISELRGVLYWMVDLLIMGIFIVLYWRLINKLNLPGTTKTAYYWKDGGATVIEFGKQKAILDDVSEIFLTRKRFVSNSISLYIKNGKQTVDLLSEPLKKDCNIENTIFYKVYSQILLENSNLVPNTNAWGEVIPYWFIKEDCKGDKK